jgi:hypothetical protein
MSHALRTQNAFATWQRTTEGFADALAAVSGRHQLPGFVSIRGQKI